MVNAHHRRALPGSTRVLGALLALYGLYVAYCVADGAVPEVMTYRVLKETFDADLYCGENDLTGARFFLPMRSRGGAGCPPAVHGGPEPSRRSLPPSHPCAATRWKQFSG